jgi:glutathione S-transferase
MRMAGTKATQIVKSRAILTISSKTYSVWSLRGWLLCRLAGLCVEEQRVERSAADRAELLLLSPSGLVPRLTHGWFRGRRFRRTRNRVLRD